VDTKYDSMRGSWCYKEVVGPFGVGWIEKLRIAVEVLLTGLRNFREIFCLEELVASSSSI
jgi:hypothetical protein